MNAKDKPRTLLKVAKTQEGLSGNTYIPDPSSLQWGIQSVSASDAGRDIDGKMHVELKTRKRKLELAWNGVNFSDTSAILKAFNPETFWVEYRDALTNTVIPKKFYVGDRTAMVHSYSDGNQWYSTVSFNIIEV